MSPLKYPMGHTSPTHRFPHQTPESERICGALCVSWTLGLSFSCVQMWKSDELNVAQVKRARRDAALPHSSLLAHIQILKFMLQKQLCVNAKYYHLFLFTALFQDIKKNIYIYVLCFPQPLLSFCTRNTVKKLLTCVKYVLRNVVSNNHS